MPPERNSVILSSVIFSLGLKGTLSEAELHFLKQRMQGGRRNKAQMGELRVRLPTGYVWHEGESHQTLLGSFEFLDRRTAVKSLTLSKPAFLTRFRRESS